MTKDLKIYFVLPQRCEDETQTTETMQQAFQICCQNQIIPDWVKEMNVIDENYNKTDIIVFQEFKGETFEKLKKSKCLIVGPWCILTCLLENIPVPNNRAPVFNMAMNNIVATASNYSLEEKKLLKQKIEFMGGSFTLQLTSAVTHLITNSVRTQKYAAASSNNIPVMLESWVTDVWNKSLTRNVKATDPEFQKHKCPCFLNLHISSTGFETQDRHLIQRLINENGGNFSGKLITTQADVLVCNPISKSEKFKVAKKAKLPCVTIEWIKDCAAKGFCLPENNYEVQVLSSTPNKNNAPWDFSMMSCISGNETTTSDQIKSSVSETLNISLFSANTPQNIKTPTVKLKENTILDLIDKIEFKQVKEAGPFLDGCGVYLVGFNTEQREKLVRIFKSAGATRYDDISDRVTQVLVGNVNCNEMKVLNTKGCGLPMVSVEWLIECIKQRQPVCEEPFIIRSTKPICNDILASPLSKKGLTLLQHDTSALEAQTETLVEMEPELDPSIQIYKNQINQEEEDTLAQLLKQDEVNNKLSMNQTKKSVDNKKNQRNDNTELTEDERTLKPLFEGKTFKLIDLSPGDVKRVSEIIDEMDGKVVAENFTGITDYAIVPPISKPIIHTAAEIVNHLWIVECQNENSLLEIEYYHQPLYSTINTKPLKNCVITISGYSGVERTFFIQLIQYLGAIYQDKFARVSYPDNSVLSSTHLISLEAKGSKYEAAVRWNKTVVTSDWLLKCVETGTRCDEKLFCINYNKTLQESKLKTNKTEKINTPVNYNKRDFEGKRISPLANQEEENFLEKLEQNLGKKLKTPERTVYLGSQPDLENVSSTEVKELNCDASPAMLKLDDGRAISITDYMKELREQGLYDTPSPPPKINAGTPVNEVLERLRREGKIPIRKLEETTKVKKTETENIEGTPVSRYLRSLKERNILNDSPNTSLNNKNSQGNNTPNSPASRPFFDIKTPDTPLGCFLEENPSRQTRKNWQRYIDTFPHYKMHDVPPATQRRPSTPLSVVKKEVWQWLLRDKSKENDEKGSSNQPVPSTSKESVPQPSKEETESQIAVSNQIGQLQDMLRRRNSIGNSRNSLLRLDGLMPQKKEFDPPVNVERKDSQVDTVGWDEPSENASEAQMYTESSNEFRFRKFMLSALNNTVRASCCNIIKSLGGEVSDLNYYDASATHVVCTNPLRNEKILSCMAAGKWIVHHSYIERSGEAGRFLDEELFEFGNPKSTSSIIEKIEKKPSMEAMHWWRLKALETKHGAFQGMRALVFSKNKAAIVRLIEAGDGVIVQAEPPFDHSVDVTHCFIDIKLKMDYKDFIPLTEQGIPCLNVLYLNNYLNNQSKSDVSNFIISGLQDYYKF